MDDRSRGSKSNGLRWAAALAVATAGAVTFVGRGRRKSVVAPALAPGRGRPLYPPDAVSLAHGYETQDTDVRKLIVIMAVSISLMIAGVATVFGMYAAFAKRDQAAVGPLTREQRVAIVPPGPHLQADPYRDIDVALTQQRRELTTYGWSDAAHTQAHIPIDRGIALIVGKPFDGGAVSPAPATAASTTAASATADPTAAKPASAKPIEGATP